MFFILRSISVRPSGVPSSHTSNGVGATKAGNGLTTKSNVTCELQPVLVLVSTAMISCGLLVLVYGTVIAFVFVSASAWLA